MTCARISELLSKLSVGALKGAPLVALLLAATLTSTVPARAQTSDTWKSVAIIGGSTAAGAYIGHRIAGSTGAYVGAAVGASAGYAIDRRRRQNEYYNNSEYGYGDGGYYPNNNSGYYPDGGGYYPNNDPNYGNGGYYGGPPNGPYPNYANSRRASRR